MVVVVVVAVMVVGAGEDATKSGRQGGTKSPLVDTGGSRLITIVQLMKIMG